MINKPLLYSMVGLALCTMTSCVHEWPEVPSTRDVALTVNHELPWKLFDYYVNSRSNENYPEVNAVRYIYEAYPKGTTAYPVTRYEELRSDMSLVPFSTTVPLPAGEWDVYVWSDYGNSDTNLSPYWDASVFENIMIRKPYYGNTDMKDAFRGLFTISVPESVEGSVEAKAEVTLLRPLSAYAFVATDVSEFIEQETRRQAMLSPDPNFSPGAIDFSKYKARLIYTSFLPSEYNMFRNRPIDSVTGVSFEGELQVVGDEVLIGFDYLIINGAETYIQVGIEIFDEAGTLVSQVNPLDIPIERNRATIVRGEFLTSAAKGGIGINPDFDGEYNIFIQ